MEILRSYFLDKLYPNGLKLDNLFVRDINFNSDDPSIEISFHSSDFPEEPPAKWLKGANYVKIILEFSEIRDLNFNKWGTHNITNLNYELDGEEYKIKLVGDDIQITFRAKWVVFKSISGY